MDMKDTGQMGRGWIGEWGNNCAAEMLGFSCNNCTVEMLEFNCNNCTFEMRGWSMFSSVGFVLVIGVDH